MNRKLIFTEKQNLWISAVKKNKKYLLNCNEEIITIRAHHHFHCSEIRYLFHLIKFKSSLKQKHTKMTRKNKYKWIKSERSGPLRKWGLLWWIKNQWSMSIVHTNANEIKLFKLVVIRAPPKHNTHSTRIHRNFQSFSCPVNAWEIFLYYV